MANQPALKNYYTFVKGLVTEANPLVAPEGACSEMSNVMLDSDGSLSSRPALEQVGSDFTLEADNSELGQHFSYAIAESILGDTAGQSRLALYLGGVYVYIFDVEDPTAPSLLAQVAMPTTTTGYRITYGRGVFCATSGDNDPVLISKESGSYASSTIPLYERDYVGIEDGYPTNYRPTVLTDEHHYNLLNQGWDDANITAVAYPSNADSMIAGIHINAATGLEAFSAAQAMGNWQDASPAPKGHIIRSVFNQSDFGDFVDYGPTKIISGYISGSGTTVTLNIVVYNDWTAAPYNGGGGYVATVDSLTIDGTWLQARTASDKSEWFNLSGTHAISSIAYDAVSDRTTIGLTVSLYESYLWTWAIGVGSVTSEDVQLYNPLAITEVARPRCSAFYAGRIWYSGIQPDTNYRLQSAVYYSQTLESLTQAGKCFTVGDPTARYNNEVVDTDGGSVIVSEMGTVYQMLVVSNSLLLFADNGVWAIVGDNQGIFTPTGFSVRKVSTRGIKTPHAAVMSDSTAVFYSNKIVYMIVQDENSGFLTAKPISDNISSYFSTLTDDSRCVAGWDAHNKRVYFTFCRNPDQYGADYLDVLVLDMQLGAFYPYAFSGSYTNTSTYKGIAGIVSLVSSYTEDTPVIFPVVERGSGVAKVSFYSLSNNAAVEDAHIATGGEFTSYFTTCHNVLDSALIKKQMPRVGVYLERRANTSLKLQGRFSWSINGDSGKWGTKQECYYERGDDFDVCWRSLSVRGIGKSLQMHFTNDGVTPFKLFGWDAKYTGNPE